MLKNEKASCVLYAQVYNCLFLAVLYLLEVDCNTLKIMKHTLVYQHNCRVLKPVKRTYIFVVVLMEISSHIHSICCRSKTLLIILKDVLLRM